jgi:gas vesicle protein
MTVTAETEVRELRELILGMREEMRIGFVQMDTKIVEVKSEIQRVESDLKSEIKRVELDLKSEIKRVELDLKSEIKRVESDLKSDIQRVEFEVKSDIQRVEAKTDVKFAELSGKIDEVKAELGGKIDVLDERTKVGFWGFIGRAVIIGIIGGGLAFGAKFFFTGELTF